MDILVICIDKDDDIGVKAEVKSPVIGRAACLDAASRLGAADPEDSDTNTIFGGIQVYDQLRAEGHNVELISSRATGSWASSPPGHRLAARRYSAEIPDGKGLLVSDGAEDESVLPILQSRLKIERSACRSEAAQNLESTYYIIKPLVNDPQSPRSVFLAQRAESFCPILATVDRSERRTRICAIA